MQATNNLKALVDVPAKKCRLLNQEMLAHLKNDDEKIVITTILIIVMAIKQNPDSSSPNGGGSLKV